VHSNAATPPTLRQRHHLKRVCRSMLYVCAHSFTLVRRRRQTRVIDVGCASGRARRNVLAAHGVRTAWMELCWRVIARRRYALMSKDNISVLIVDIEPARPPATTTVSPPANTGRELRRHRRTKNLKV
jgi:hypothetical protein